MNELETQVAKIQIGDPKQATAYVYVMAEKIDATDTELYVLCELPLFNPAAKADCEQISETIGASLKRSYRKTVNDNTFENALAQINEELGKLASFGKTHWIGKLNGLVAAKRGQALSIATVGKITALLFRDDNFATIAESTTAPNPLKTFENFAIGKLRLNDLLIFSTTQLFNHISIDRIKHILHDDNLPQAAGAIIDILRENAGPEVACGTILALQVEPGQGQDEEIDLAQYINTPPPENAPQNLKEHLFALPAKVFAKASQFTQQTLKTVRSQQRPDVRSLLTKNRAAIGVVNQQFKKATAQLSPETFRGFSNQKKFFFISAAILFVALIASLLITRQYQSNKEEVNTVKTNISELQKLANDTDAAIIYGDTDKARSLFNDLQTKLASQTEPEDSEAKTQLEAVKKQAADLDDKLNKRTTPQVTNVATLSNAETLISLPSYLATETKRTIVSYNRTSGSVQDNALRVSEPITASAFMKNSSAAIHNGKELFIWNFQTGLVAGPFSENVPAKENMAGLKFYPTNNRVYSVDKANGRIVSYLTSDKGLSQPVISVPNTPDLKEASDLAIDGNIYVATKGTILKFLSGKQQAFTPALPSALSNAAKLYTQLDYTNIYVLDGGNNRILILNKQGGLVGTLISPQFSHLQDFTVDEKTKTIFILQDGALLKLNF